MSNPNPNTSGLKKGRAKGSKNKNESIASLRNKFIASFEAIGGTDKLQEWALSSPRNLTAFYSILSGIMPKAQEISLDSKVTLDLSSKLLAAKAQAEKLYLKTQEPQHLMVITNQGNLEENPITLEKVNPND